MGRAIALKPWTFNARGATVLDEEVAGLQLDVEWTEGVEERVRELLERSTLKRGDFDGVHDLNQHVCQEALAQSLGRGSSEASDLEWM